MDAAKKILIIDDEIDLTQMIGFQFKAKGFDVQTACDGLLGSHASGLQTGPDNSGYQYAPYGRHRIL